MNALLQRLYHDEKGQALYLVAAALVGLLGMAALSIDIGYALHGQRELQASADAAASAGALDLPNSASSAITDAKTTSGIPGSENAIKDLSSVRLETPGTTIAGPPVVTCFQPCTGTQSTNCLPNASTAPACSYYNSTTQTTITTGNVVVVQESGVSPTFFAKIFGFGSVTLRVTSVAMARGTAPLPINIFMVTDTTESMTSTDPNCGITDWGTGFPTPTKEDCAKWGIRMLLTGLNPSVQNVGLVTFPAVNPTSDGAEHDCWSPQFASGGSSCSEAGIVPYSCASADFLVVPLKNDYLNSSGNLSSSSDLVGAVSWDGPDTCTTTTTGSGRGSTTVIHYGLQDPGGEATRYGEAITEAQDVLVETPDVASAIIVLGDGTVNTGSTPCSSAVTAAQAATAAGTSVYAVGYDIPGGTCGQGYTYCQVMQGIASSPSNFYADSESAANGCASTANVGLTSLGSIFKGLAEQLGTTRLLPSSLYVPPGS
jgi:hypothetical protein